MVDGRAEIMSVPVVDHVVGKHDIEAILREKVGQDITDQNSDPQ